MTGMDDLVTFLRAQLDDDGRVARAAADLAEAGEWDSSPEGHVHDPAYTGPGWRYLAVGPDHRSLDDIGVHIARWDPARVLAEVDAKRRIPDAAEWAFGIAAAYPKADPGPDLATQWWVVRVVALPYADRPGYREEWRP